MIFNMVGGGGGKVFGAIVVNYPAGSKCTCTNGSKTFEAKNDSGQWIFVLPKNEGPWTVTSTDDQKHSMSKTGITIGPNEGSFQVVTLSYSLELFSSTNGLHEDYMVFNSYIGKKNGDPFQFSDYGSTTITYSYTQGNLKLSSLLAGYI